MNMLRKYVSVSSPFRIALFCFIYFCTSFANAENFVTVGPIRLVSRLMIPGGIGSNVSGTNCIVGVDWGHMVLADDSWPAGGLPGYNVEFAEANLEFGGEVIPIIPNGRTQFPGLSVRYQSNHFYHGQTVTMSLIVKFRVNGSLVSVTDTGTVKIYNYGAAARTQENATVPPLEHGPLVNVLSAFVAGKHKLTAIDYEPLTGNVVNDLPVHIGEFSNSNFERMLTECTAFYVQAHGSNEAFTNNLRTRVTQVQISNYRYTAALNGVPPINIAHLDCCNTGGQHYPASGSGTAFDLNNAFLVPFDVNQPIVDRSFCSWNCISYPIWHMQFTPVFWQKLRDGNTVFESREFAFEALLRFYRIDPTSVSPPPVWLAGLNDPRDALIMEIIRARGDLTQIFKIWGDQDTTFNSLYVDNTSSRWYKVMN